MSKTSRQEIFSQAAKKLRQDFEELSTVPHNQLKGGQAEKLVRSFLRAHIPKRFDVGSGFIIDRFDNISRQTDLIIYDAQNCPVYRASEEAGIFPNQNVAGLVEVKSKLDRDRLLEAIENIRDAKRLAKIPAPEGSVLTAHNFGYLFAFTSSISLDTIADHYAEFFKADKFRLGDHIDGICVLDVGTVTLSARPRGMRWGRYIHEGVARRELSEGLGFGLAISEMKRDALDAFLRDMLSRLSTFWAIMDHPGFEWSSEQEAHVRKLMFLCTICHETDPEKRRALELKYQQEVHEEFANLRPN